MSETASDTDADETPGFTITSENLNDFLTPISQLVDECRLHLESDGLTVRAVDPANVAMIDVSLDAAAFERYAGNGSVLGINLDRLEDIINAPADKDLISIELDPDTHKLHIEAGAMDYQMALIDPDSVRQEPDFPDLDLDYDIGISDDQLDEMITTADIVSDHLAFFAEDGRFGAIASGDTDDAEIDYTADEIERLDGSGKVESLYSLDYLNEVNSGISTEGTVTIELGDEFPILVNWTFANTAGAGTYMVAPRIESD